MCVCVCVSVCVCVCLCVCDPFFRRNRILIQKSWEQSSRRKWVVRPQAPSHRSTVEDCRLQAHPQRHKDALHHQAHFDEHWTTLAPYFHHCTGCQKAQNSVLCSLVRAFLSGALYRYNFPFPLSHGSPPFAYVSDIFQSPLIAIAGHGHHRSQCVLNAHWTTLVQVISGLDYCCGFLTDLLSSRLVSLRSVLKPGAWGIPLKHESDHALSLLKSSPLSQSPGPSSPPSSGPWHISSLVS